MSEKLKSCPHCGGEAEVITDRLEKTTEFYVECSDCFCRTDTVVNVGDRADKDCIRCVIEDWNRRVENKRVKQACEYLKKCLEEMTSFEGDIMSFLKDVAEEE